MKEPKSSVSKRFSKASRCYHKNAALQRGIARELITGLRSIEPSRVLDIGCGTGFLTEGLLERFPNLSIDAVDIAPDMIAEARSRLGEARVRWFVQDVASFVPDCEYDLIVSSSALQWMQPLESLFRTLHSVLVGKGRLVFSLMADGTLAELHTLRRELAPDKRPARALPKLNEVQAALRSAGFRVGDLQIKSFREEYLSANDFLASIRELGFTGGELSHGEKLLSRSELKELIKLYDQRFTSPAGGVFATFTSLQIDAGPV